MELTPDAKPQCPCPICRLMRWYEEQKIKQRTHFMLYGQPRRGADSGERGELISGAIAMLKMACSAEDMIDARRAVLWGLKNDRTDPIWKKVCKAVTRTVVNWEEVRRVAGGLIR